MMLSASHYSFNRHKRFPYPINNCFVGMAKEDFCFNFYDGDATRDMFNMNRLERGGYTDIIISQRKFGWLSLDQIKKILGRDFEVIWPAIELVMIHEDGKYYIEWLNNSVLRSVKHSAKQSENGKKGGRPSKNKRIESKNETQIKANIKPTENQKKPLEDEYGNGYGNEDEEKGGVGEKTGDQHLEFAIELDMPLPDTTLVAAEMNQFTFTSKKNTQFIEAQWKVFLSERINDPPERRRNYRQLSDLTTYFLNWMRTKLPKIENQNGTHKQTSFTGHSGL